MTFRRTALALLLLTLAACRHTVPEGIPLYPIKQKGRWGYISADGRVQIPARFEMAYPFKEGRARIRLGGGEGFINRLGELAVLPIFFQVNDFSEGMARVWPRQRLASDSLVDRAAGLTSPRPLDKPPVAYATLDGKLFAETAQVLDAGDFHEGYASAQAGWHDWRFINKAGVIANQRFSWEPSDFSEGMAIRVNVADFDHHVGFQDMSGKQFIPLTWDGAQPFSDGLAGVKSGDVWGFVDHSGTVVVPPSFLEIRDFSEGAATVHQSLGWFYIDKTGRPFLPGPYEEASRFHDGRAVVRVGGSWHIIDKQGLGPDVPSGLEPANPKEGFVDGLLAVKRGDAFGYLRPDASFAWAPTQ